MMPAPAKKPAGKNVAKTPAKSLAKSSAKPSSKISAPSTTRKPAVAGLAVGGKAPGFKLSDDTGRVRQLSDFAGNALVLYFYPKDNTPGCTQESCDFRDNLNRLTATGAAVVGLSADSVESHRKFKEKYGLNFPLLSDPDHAALNAYGVWQEKSLYGRKFMGIVRSTFVIDGKGVIRAHFPKVKVAGHVDEVLTVLRDLKSAGKPN
jgi:peroxiredoxin Q/BCP